MDSDETEVVTLLTTCTCGARVRVVCDDVDGLRSYLRVVRDDANEPDHRRFYFECHQCGKSETLTVS